MACDIVVPMSRAPALVLFVAFAGCEPTFEPRDAGVYVPQRAPDCLVMPDIDFGGPIARATQSFKLNNGSSTVRTITVGPVEPPFTLSINGEASIGVGEGITLVATFTPVDGLAHFSSFEFVGGRGCAPQTVRLRGVGAGSLVVPRVVDFGAVPIGVPTTRPFVIVNSSREPMSASLRVQTVVGTAFTVSPSSLVVEPQSTALALVTITAPRRGLVNSVLTMEGAFTPTFTELRASGGVPRVEVPTVDLDLPTFAGVAGPAWARRSLRPVNTGDGPLTFSLPSPFFTVSASEGEGDVSLSGLSGQPLEPGDALPMVLEVRTASPTAERAWEITLRASAPAPVRFTVRAHRVEFPACEQIVVEPASVALGFVARGATVTSQLTLRNVGQTECVIDDLHVETTASWRTTSPARLTIPPGGEATVPLSVTMPNQPSSLQGGSLEFRALSPTGEYTSVPLTAHTN